MEKNEMPFRDKLGLALAGGGFRASLFHLGVFRRMAEMDLLRYVEVLSTVSGGSIIGALYILLLKREIDNNTVLSKEKYIEIINSGDEKLIECLETYLNSWDTVSDVYSYYKKFLEFERDVQNAGSVEAVKELADNYHYLV